MLKTAVSPAMQQCTRAVRRSCRLVCSPVAVLLDTTAFDPKLEHRADGGKNLNDMVKTRASRAGR